MAKKLMLLVGLFVVFGVTALRAAPEKAPAGVNATKDTDGDGLPDWWELKYFGKGAVYNRFNGKLDPDGDKVTTDEEYKLRTNPNDKNIDKNHDGVADDWAKYWKSKDRKADMSANADPDKDGASNKAEYEAGTNPLDPKSYPNKKETISQKHPTPSMVGVRANIDKSIPKNHMIRPDVFKYNDPIGDDKGPGYYTYPTNPVYTSGSFDILSFTVDASSKNNVVFKITVNADLKQDWGMAADFDVQYFQIYIDEDNVPGSGHVKCIPGINVFFNPAHAWDKVVLVSPQPQSRVQIEVDVKAKSFADDVVIPTQISGQGRTITAVVSKKALGAESDTDFSKWAWQVVSQSNEGFPDPEDVLTRNVNEYRGQHRFGGGSDYWGDPELMDILVWPAMGTLQEAKDQFSILNVWESYPDPKLNILAVLPLILNNEAAQWMPKGGYKAYAKALAAKIKPPAQKDKYVSDNFSLSTKIFTRWTWNLDPTKENFIKNSLEVQFFGKAFTDRVGYYMRWEIANWDNTIWTLWNNSTPGQQPIVLQAFRGILVKPLPTVDTISIGNYELDYSPWVMGSAWYPDRDKFKGIFIDGSVEGLMDYHLTIHYPLNWIGIDWSHGQFKADDFAYGVKLHSSTLVRGLNASLVGALYTDYEMSPVTSTNNRPTALLLRGYNLGVSGDVSYKLKLGSFADLSLETVVSYTELKLGENFKNLEKALHIDIDGNGVYGGLKGGGINPDHETAGMAGVMTVKLENILGAISVLGQGFYIDHDYTALGAARGDTAVGSFGGSPTADVLEMAGNQSVSRAPQAADFVSSVPLAVFPSDFMLSDPVTSTKGIGWINDNWEGIAAMGWQGGTLKGFYQGGLLKASGEFSLITFNDPSYTNKREMRGYVSAEYDLGTIHSKVFLQGKFYSLYNPLDTNFIAMPIILSPSVSFLDQVSKYMSVMLTYRYDMGKYQEYDINQASYTNTKYIKRHRIGLDVSYSMPVGTIKMKGEYWFAPRGAGKNDYASSIPAYGAYAVTEWEFAF